MIPLWAKLLAAAALVAGLVGWGWSGGAASKQKEWDLAKAAQVQAQLEATEQARATEQALQQRVNDANTALQTERTKHARVAAGLKRDADSLRDSIASFAGGKPDDTATACGERAATLGALLDDALRASGECASQAESVASDLRATLAAWPK